MDVNKEYFPRKGYQLEEHEIYVDTEFKLLKRSAIQKIKSKERIRIEIVKQEINELLDGESVYLTGRGEKYNSDGFMVGQTVETASATPRNCKFDYRLEVAQKRLESRIVCGLAGLHEWLGQDELKPEKIPAALRESDTKGQEALNDAIEKMTATPQRV